MRLPRLSTVHLATLSVLTQFDTYTEVGDHLSITGSAVGHRVREIEHRLGCKIVTNRGKSFQLTDIGQDFSRRANNIVEELLLLEMDFDGSHSQTIKIGVCSSVPACLHRALSGLVSKGDVSVEYVLHSLVDHPDAQKLMEFDVILSTCSQNTRLYQSETLFIDSLVVYASPGDEWSQRRSLEPSDIEHRLSITFKELKHIWDNGLLCAQSKGGGKILSFGLGLMEAINDIGLSESIIIGSRANIQNLGEIPESNLIPIGNPEFSTELKLYTKHTNGHFRGLSACKQKLINASRQSLQQP